MTFMGIRGLICYMKRKSSGPSAAHIGAALRLVIRESGRTQEDVARAAGVPTRTFMRYLAGDSAMPASAMLGTAIGLGVSAGDLADLLVNALGRTKPPAGDDDLPPDVLEALAKSETKLILEGERVKPATVIKSKRRSAS